MDFLTTNFFLILVILISGALFLYPSFFSDNSFNVKVNDALLIMNREPNIIIDVRDIENFKAGHISNAINVPFDNFLKNIEILKLKQKKRILIYCNSGNSALKATKILRKNGFDSVLSIHGGLNEWKKCHLPLIQSK